MRGVDWPINRHNNLLDVHLRRSRLDQRWAARSFKSHAKWPHGLRYKTRLFDIWIDGCERYGLRYHHQQQDGVLQLRKRRNFHRNGKERGFLVGNSDMFVGQASHFNGFGQRAAVLRFASQIRICLRGYLIPISSGIQGGLNRSCEPLRSYNQMGA